MHPRAVRSADGDLAHVDGDQQWLRDELIVALPGVAPARGRDDDAVDVAVAGGVEHPGRPAEDVDGEVMAAQQPVRAEARDLLAGVALDVIGERYFQPPPRFTADLDGGDLFGDEPGARCKGTAYSGMSTAPPRRNRRDECRPTGSRTDDRQTTSPGRRGRR